MAEGKRLIPVFQGTVRSAGGVRRLNASTRTRGWDTPRRDTVGSWEKAILTTDGTKTVKRHARSLVVGGVGGSG